MQRSWLLLLSLAAWLALGNSGRCEKRLDPALAKTDPTEPIAWYDVRQLDVEGKVAFANYRLVPGTVIITHTETPPALRGRGIASELVRGALEMIRADGHKVVAGCGFVVDYLDKHPEFADLVG